MHLKSSHFEFWFNPRPGLLYFKFRTKTRLSQNNTRLNWLNKIGLSSDTGTLHGNIFFVASGGLYSCIFTFFYIELNVWIFHLGDVGIDICEGCFFFEQSCFCCTYILFNLRSFHSTPLIDSIKKKSIG